MRIEPGGMYGGVVVDWIDEVIVAVEDGEVQRQARIAYHDPDDEMFGAVPEERRLRTDYDSFVSEYASSNETE